MLVNQLRFVLILQLQILRMVAATAVDANTVQAFAAKATKKAEERFAAEAAQSQEAAKKKEASSVSDS